MQKSKSFNKKKEVKEEDEDSDFRYQSDNDQDDDFMDDAFGFDSQDQGKKQTKHKQEKTKQKKKKNTNSKYQEDDDDHNNGKPVSDIWLKMIQNNQTNADTKVKKTKIEGDNNNNDKDKKKRKRRKKFEEEFNEENLFNNDNCSDDQDDMDEDEYENKVKSQIMKKDQTLLPVYQKLEQEILKNFKIAECAKFIPEVEESIQNVLDPTEREKKLMKDFQNDEDLQYYMKIFSEDIYKQAFFFYRKEAFFGSNQDWFKNVIRNVAQLSLGQKRRNSTEDEIYWFTTLVHLAFRILTESDDEQAEFQARVRARIAFLKIMNLILQIESMEYAQIFKTAFE